MGLTDIKSYLIGLVLAMVIIFGGIFTLSSFKSENPTIDTSRMDTFNQTFYLAENVTTAVESISDSIDATGEKPGALGWFNVLFGSSWQGLKALKSSLGFVNAAVYGVADFFDVPKAIARLIILLPIIVIVFAIWGAIIQAQD